MEILNSILAWSKNWRREAFGVAFANSAPEGEEAVLFGGPTTEPQFCSGF